MMEIFRAAFSTGHLVGETRTVTSQQCQHTHKHPERFHHHQLTLSLCRAASSRVQVTISSCPTPSSARSLSKFSSTSFSRFCAVSRSLNAGMAKVGRRMSNRSAPLTQLLLQHSPFNAPYSRQMTCNCGRDCGGTWPVCAAAGPTL